MHQTPALSSSSNAKKGRISKGEKNIPQQKERLVKAKEPILLLVTKGAENKKDYIAENLELSRVLSHLWQLSQAFWRNWILFPTVKTVLLCPKVY